MKAFVKPQERAGISAGFVLVQAGAPGAAAEEKHSRAVAELQQKLKKAQDELQRHLLEAQIRQALWSRILSIAWNESRSWPVSSSSDH